MRNQCLLLRLVQRLVSANVVFMFLVWTFGFVDAAPALAIPDEQASSNDWLISGTQIVGSSTRQGRFAKASCIFGNFSSGRHFAPVQPYKVYEITSSQTIIASIPHQRQRLSTVCSTRFSQRAHFEHAIYGVCVAHTLPMHRRLPHLPSNLFCRPGWDR